MTQSLRHGNTDVQQMKLQMWNSRQASVLTLKCSWSQRWSVNSITLWLWSANVFATKSVPFEFHMDNRVVHLGAEALPRCSWTFIHGCMSLICFVICNIIRLLWVGVVAHCVDSYHFLGVYTELAALTSAPKSVAGARPHFSPRWMTSMITWTNDCDLPAPTPTTYTKHTPRAVA